MKKLIGKEWNIMAIKDGVLFSDPVAPYFSKYLSSTRLEQGTINTYIISIERYFMYALFFENKDKLSIKEYFANYYQALKRGFEILEEREEAGLKFNYLVFSSEPMKGTTINKEWAALSRYYEYLADDKNRDEFPTINNFPIDIYYDKIDELYERAKERYSASRTGTTLKLSGEMKKLYAKRESIFKDFTASGTQREAEKDKGGVVPFPPKYFNSLLEVAEPRDRLLYLLCGMASPRVSQALNITTFDIKFSTKQGEDDSVWICKPNSNQRPRLKNGSVYMNQPGRNFLLADKYNINPDASPHNINRCKYPIPVKRADNSLWFFSPSHKKQLFDLLQEILKNNLPESSTGHPFIFQTSTGGRYLRTKAHTNYKRNLEKLQLKHPEYDFSHIKGIHSLRHLFGQLMAIFALRLEANRDLINKRNNTMYERGGFTRIWKRLTANVMGHSDIKSVDTYFNVDEDTMNVFIDSLTSLANDDMMNFVLDSEIKLDFQDETKENK